MVKVIGFAVRENGEGDKFCVLLLGGELELIKSASGKHYATMRQCSLPSTLNEESCKALVGSELPGRVTKVPCEEYQYVTHSGQKLNLDYTWEYVESGSDDAGAGITGVFE